MNFLFRSLENGPSLIPPIISSNRTLIMNLLMYPALFVFALLLFVLIETILGERRIQKLASVKPLDLLDPPLVSVVIPALNEEEKIEAALASVLALDYPRLEIIVLNDRSSDTTPKILERISEEHPRLRVIHIQELPAGWLGKNHALHFGAQQAQGEFLLFTDADVQMAPDTLRRAMTRIQEHNLDHLCLILRLAMPTSLLSMLVTDSLSGLLTMFKPWLLIDPDSRSFLGVGAVNLVRT
ncbi:MAG: glycosyltransferase, partial [Candidatus Electrothrix sp. AR3]|nr:glycosyltransferase [Candidatus Electrothrix sp. AR3]